jgi:hypothetical protein
LFLPGWHAQEFGSEDAAAHAYIVSSASVFCEVDLEWPQTPEERRHTPAGWVRGFAILCNAQ